jgi:DNA-binding CsgD family transcriptional regulator
VAGGLTNAQIAALLGTSRLTVKSHLEHAAVKLDAHGRAGTVGAAFRAGWLR